MRAPALATVAISACAAILSFASPAAADKLRNLQPGEVAPSFSLPTVRGDTLRFRVEYGLPDNLLVIQPDDDVLGVVFEVLQGFHLRAGFRLLGCRDLEGSLHGEGGRDHEEDQQQEGDVDHWRHVHLGFARLALAPEAPLNTNELDFVQKFSLLVMSDDHGAVVREAAPPKR